MFISAINFPDGHERFLGEAGAVVPDFGEARLFAAIRGAHKALSAAVLADTGRLRDCTFQVREIAS